MECCSNNLGRFPHNAEINTSLVAGATGEYIIELYNMNGTVHTKKVEVSISEDIIIPRPFNEDYYYTMKIKNPQGTYIEKDGSQEFCFETYININDECNADNTCDDSSEDTGSYVDGDN